MPYMDHTVLPATRHRWLSRLYPSRSWHSILRPRRDARLSLPGTYRRTSSRMQCSLSVIKLNLHFCASCQHNLYNYKSRVNALTGVCHVHTWISTCSGHYLLTSFLLPGSMYKINVINKIKYICQIKLNKFTSFFTVFRSLVAQHNLSCGLV